MSILIREQNYLEDGTLCCVGCDTSSIDVVIETNNIRIGMCEHCLKQFVADAASAIAELDHKCRNCIHYRKPNNGYDYNGECHIHKVEGKYPSASPKGCCPNFRFG